LCAKIIKSNNKGFLKNKLYKDDMRNKINEILRVKYKVINDDEISDQLYEFIEMMINYNKTHNLTSITEENDIIFKHLLDSLLPIALFNNNERVLDIGCGAGFPSIPIAIANKKVNITAIDSVTKKTDFVEMVKNKLKLSNLSVFHTRIEDFARKKEFRESFDVVVSRAVASLNVIIEYSAPMLKNGGYIYAYKGINVEEEIKTAKNALKELDCTIEEIKEYPVEELGTSRYLIKIKKNSTIKLKYPRIQNKPRTNPL
jgi:16S rRNA (guanine527-N7)-methyltransferase